VGKQKQTNKGKFNKSMDPGKIDFVGKAKGFAIGSVTFVIVALALIFTKGLNYGIDFAGGTEIQVKFASAVSTAEVRDSVKANGFENSQVQSIGEENEFIVRIPIATGKTDREINEKNKLMVKQMTTGLTKDFPSQRAEIRRVDSVGPQVGSELKRNGILAVFYSLLLILIYVGLRFDYEFAPGAVICLFHDAIITLGIFALLGKEVNIQILAAILTIIGYSLNDTIVNYDRIRENMALFKGNLLATIFNRSINETLTRTILTSVTAM